MKYYHITTAYGLTNIDYGTSRLWGNKTYHGVRSIHVSNSKEN